MRGLKYSEKNQCRGSAGSHRSRGAWIEIDGTSNLPSISTSHRSRGVWIEIIKLLKQVMSVVVASLTRCVD